MKLIRCFLLVLAMAAFCGCENDTNESDRVVKVLIDTDMVEGFDDGEALMMLASSPEIDVVGVTTVTGNTWAAEGVAYAIRQLEICGAKSIPVISGSQYPLRDGRFATLKSEVASNPGKDSDWLGAVEYGLVTNWRDAYVNRYKEQPTLSPVEDDAVDFIIRMLKTYPGEVALLAIGPCTNIAKALLKEPGIERLAKEIVYMGGSYYTDGNTTPYAEFNILCDPEAAAICMRAPFAQQTIVSLDVCNTVMMDAKRYDDMCSHITDAKLLQIFRNCFHYDDFKSNPSHVSSIWDVISAAVVMDKSIIKEFDNVRIDVQDNPSKPEYGRTFVTTDVNRQFAHILTSVNADRIWDLVYEPLK